MKTLEYFQIEYCMKFAKPWDKELGWSVWHSCFDCEHECGSEFVAWSGGVELIKRETATVLMSTAVGISIITILSFFIV